MLARAPRFYLGVLATATAIGLGSCGGGGDSSAGPGTGPGPGAAQPSTATSTVSLSSATLASGSNITVTLQVKDASGNNLATTGLSVAFSLAAGTSDGTFGAVTSGAGVYSATFTGTTAGSARTIGATISGTAVTSTLPAVTVTPGPVSLETSALNASAATVTSGATATVTLQAKDAANNNLATGGLTVAFALAGTGTSSGTLSAVTDNGNGAYSTIFTGTIAGTARAVSATIGGTAAAKSTSLTVNPGLFSDTASQVVVARATVQLGDTSRLTARLKDAAGNSLATGGATVIFNKGPGTSDGTIGTVTDNSNGTYTAIYTATTAGTAQIVGATVNGKVILSTPPTITVTSAPAPAAGPISASNSIVSVSSANVTSGATATITLQAKDASGTSLTTGGATVAFSLGATGTSTGTIGAVTDNSNGTYTATLTGVLAGSARGVAATIDGTAVTTTQPTFTVVPGAASVGTSVITASSSSIASGTTATLTLQTKDAAGNSLTAGGATVAFSLGSGSSAGTIGTVTDNANGTYSAIFTGTTAGTARTINATLNSTAVTTTSPAITVTVGAISAQSVVTVSAANIEAAGTSTLTLTAKDAGGSAITTGGATVVFTKGTGTSDGTIGGVTDVGNGTYTATFTGSTVGTEREIGATVGGTAVTTTPPGITVYTKGITLSTGTVQVNATTGEAATQQIVGVFANGGASAAGLAASVVYQPLTGSNCTTATWLGTLSFDFTTANPVALVSFTPTAAGLGVYTCTATVTISSTTPGVASKTFDVNLSVARGAVGQGAITLVTMGNAGNNVVQSLVPDAKILITNGGRGVVTGLHATVDGQSGTGSTNPWITAANLSWATTPTDTNARLAPNTLIVTMNVKPFNASATIHVTGSGIATIDIPVNVLFNTNPELVTNARSVGMSAFVGANNTFSVVAFNQNRAVFDSLKNYAWDSGLAIPSWLSVGVVPLTNAGGRDTAATVTLTVNPSTLFADSTYSTTVRVKADVCSTDGVTNVCTVPGGPTVKTYDIPVKLLVERGLVVSVADATLMAPVGNIAVTKDIGITNGGSTAISGLSVGVGGATWLSAAFTAGTAAPSTVRLTASPTGLKRGTVVSTTVTISASSPTGVPSKSFPVTLRVY